MAFEPWHLAAMDEAGYNGIRMEHLERVAREIEKLPQDVIDTDAFRTACRRAGVDPDNFNQGDMDDLQCYLNR